MILLSLPPEIIDKICKLFCTYCQMKPLSYFPHKEALATFCSGQIWEHDAQGVKTLVNLSETCQALNVLTLPHRYHRIKLKSDILYAKEFIAHIRGCGHNALDHRNVPKIQLLHIRFTWELDIKISHRTILASLRYLHIERSGSGYRDSLKISDLLRTAPKIETLVIQVKSLSWSSKSSGLENVKCLKLVDTLVSPYDLKRILDSCSQLESFVFSLFAEIPRWLESLVNYFTGLQTLPQVLSVRQETLRYVALYWEPPPAGNDNGMNIAGSFKGLTNLETLILGGSGLRFEKAENEKTLRACLVNLLPQSIRSVTIDSENTSLHEPILALGEAVKLGSFPMLKEVRCYSWGEGDLMGLALEEASAGPSYMTRQKMKDRHERSKHYLGLLSQLSRTCNVSLSAESKGLFERGKIQD
ncbi:hypothetical protein FMEXI_6928 [Fusarium mexicanum]|uniref:F-box domain-containing protein n=1 Tax=Fusarium mexicanum TaxID=751941 RepID=A0A8H5IZI9_9HYPO|nr:hypothetical protein FMEXI_6928 [Fusarium mexicanum]